MSHNLRRLVVTATCGGTEICPYTLVSIRTATSAGKHARAELQKSGVVLKRLQPIAASYHAHISIIQAQPKQQHRARHLLNVVK